MKKFTIFITACFLSMFVFAQVNLHNKQIELEKINQQEVSKENNKDESFLIRLLPENLEAPKDGSGYIMPLNSHNFDNFKVDESKFKNLPATYDLRTLGRVTPAKNQGNTPACWAFAGCGAVESYWLTVGEGTYDLSEQNLATCHGFSFNPSTSGGNAIIITSYLTNFTGPVLESQDPFTLGSGDTSCSSGIAPAGFINQARAIPPKNIISGGSIVANPNYNINAVKQAIIDYGAIFTSNQSQQGTWSGWDYCYTGTANVDHGIALVGWDDNRSTACGTTGSWIVKNSGGPGYMDGGYFYMAYADTRGLTGEVFAWPSYIPYDSNIKVYQHDKYGMVAAYEDSERFALTKFTATHNHQLTQIGTGIYNANTNVTIDVFSNFNGSSLNNSDIIASISQQNCNYPGFHTFDLPTPLSLTTGQDFYVRVSYSIPSIPAEANVGYMYGNFVAANGKYWISNNASSGWTAWGAGTNYPYNIVVKAYAGTEGGGPPVVECETVTEFPWSEGFEGTIFPPECWTSIDNDGDGQNWFHYKNFDNDGEWVVVANTGEGCAASASWWQDPLYPDNYLVTPQIAIPSEGATLKYYIAAQDPDWPEERYEIKVSTTGTSPANFTSIFNETLSSDTWLERTQSLDNYAGQDIYIAFVHTGVSDQFFIKLDDINISTPVSVEGNISSNIKVFPNPANDIITITNAENTSIEILNILGEVVHTTENASSFENIDVSSLSNGTYFVRINTEVFKINIVK